MVHDFYSYLLWHMRHAESLADKLCKDDIDEETYRTLITDCKSFEKNLETIVVKIHGEQCCCPMCNAKFPTYLPFGIVPRKDAMCPNCYSLERHRALWFLLKRLNWNRPNMRVLHFAPEIAFYEIFSSKENIEYWPVDLNPEIYEGRVKKSVDITNIPFEDSYFDLIMCTHVLEHIPDDKKAMSELYRVLKPNDGVALLTVPIFDRPKTLENPEYNTPELRTKYYGQHDHVRAYGFDYPEKLKTAGFSVTEFVVPDFCDESTISNYRLNPNERFHICRKLIE